MSLWVEFLLHKFERFWTLWRGAHWGVSNSARNSCPPWKSGLKSCDKLSLNSDSTVLARRQHPGYGRWPSMTQHSQCIGPRRPASAPILTTSTRKEVQGYQVVSTACILVNVDEIIRTSKNRMMAFCYIAHWDLAAAAPLYTSNCNHASSDHDGISIIISGSVWQKDDR